MQLESTVNANVSLCYIENVLDSSPETQKMRRYNPFKGIDPSKKVI
jgi:hypothetical protein